MNIKLGDAAKRCEIASEAFHITPTSAVGAVSSVKRSNEERERSRRSIVFDGSQQTAVGGVLQREEKRGTRAIARRERRQDSLPLAGMG